jgi:hypothetical protein
MDYSVFMATDKNNFEKLEKIFSTERIAREILA